MSTPTGGRVYPQREPDPDDLLAHWQERALLALFAYNRAANRCMAWDTRIGGAVAVLTAVIGTTVFATLSSEPSTFAKIVVGLVSVTAAIFAGVQAFAGLPQRIEDYRKAARRYGAIRRDIEQTRVELSGGPADVYQQIARVRSTLDEAAEAHPNAPQRIWDKTRRHIKGEFTRWERGADRIRGLPPRSKLGLVRGED